MVENEIKIKNKSKNKTRTRIKEENEEGLANYRKRSKLSSSEK